MKALFFLGIVDNSNNGPRSFKPKLPDFQMREKKSFHLVASNVVRINSENLSR